LNKIDLEFGHLHNGLHMAVICRKPQYIIMHVKTQGNQLIEAHFKIHQNNWIFICLECVVIIGSRAAFALLIA